MQIVTATFDKVFDVHQRFTGRPSRRVTEFSFEANGTKHYGVSVPGWLEIEAGHTVKAVLYEDENWQTLDGWVNQNTGEATGPSISTTVYGFGASLCMSAFLAIQAYQSLGAIKTMFGVGAFALGFLSLILGRQFLRQRETITTLSTLTTPSSRPPSTIV